MVYQLIRPSTGHVDWDGVGSNLQHGAPLANHDPSEAGGVPNLANQATNLRADLAVVLDAAFIN